MRTIRSQQSKGIFRQLAAVEGGVGVRCVIENHDAWVRNAETLAEITAALRTEARCRLRSEETARRIAAQRDALAGLVVRLPLKLSHAG